MSAVTWASVSARVARNDLPALAFRHWWDLDRPDRVTAVMRAWAMAEWPEQAIPTRYWVQMFADACDEDPALYLADGEIVNRAEDLAGLLVPDDRIRLYRGAIPARAVGMSWTGDLDRARWFARRFDGIPADKGGRVYVLDVPIEYVLAHITGRGEDEYVLDAADLDEPHELGAEGAQRRRKAPASR